MRSVVADVAAAVVAVAVGVAASWQAADATTTVIALLTGASFGVLRSRPATVTTYLAATLVVCDLADLFAGNAVQLLLTVSLGVLARRARTRVLVPIALLAGAANVLKLAAAPVVPHLWAWLLPVCVTVAPVLLGRFARVSGPPPAGRLELADVLLGASGAVLAVLERWSDWVTGTISPASGVLACAGLALTATRRRPVTVLMVQYAAVAVFCAVPARPLFAMPILLCAATGVYVAGAGRVRGVVAVLVSWGALVVTLDRNPAPLPLAGTAILATLLLVLTLAIVRHVAVRREADRRRLASLEAEARAGERELIAREVHDVVAHHIGAVVLMSGAARMAVRDDDAAVRRALTDIRSTAQHTLVDLRALLEVLRDPSTPMVRDLCAALDDVVARVEAAGLPVRLDADPDVPDLPLLVRAALLRIVQESLTNALKHAGSGATATVRIRTGGARTCVEVLSTAPGRPPGPASGDGMGVAGMRERASALGGDLTAGPDGRGGWAVVGHLPAAGPEALAR